MGKGKAAKRIKVHYTGRLDDGSVVESSRSGEPFVVPLGHKRVIPGFEEAIAEMNPGQKKKVTIPPEKAYGPHRAELVTRVPRSKFPDSLRLRVGQHLQLRNTAGMSTRALVTALNEESATLDANHPLAGKTLHFDIEVLEVI